MIEKLLAGDRRTAARLITMVENNEPEKQEILKALYPHTGKATIIGITGSPGAGKSSLTDQLIRAFRKQNKKVGVIAVDPTSPFSGGAILGDRIRMNEHYMDSGVFIRSMGTRGSLGGLARASKEVVKVFDAFGCDYILIETVGVGQSELEIMTVADTTLVVLVPGAGDSIQAIKAGIMEIADIFVINKADLDGAERVVTEVNAMLDLSTPKEWRPPVVKTSTISITGMDDLTAAIDKHQEYLHRDDRLAIERRKRLKLELAEITDWFIKDLIRNKVEKSGQWEVFLEKVINREMDPHTAAEQIIEMGLIRDREC